MNKTVEKKPFFNAWNELFVALVGAVITGIIATIIAYHFERSLHESRLEANNLQVEIESAQKIYTEVSSLMDSRLYHSTQILDGISSQYSLGYVEASWEKYLNILYEWNSNWHRINSLTKLYYGEELHDRYASEVNWRFVELHRELREAKFMYFDQYPSIDAIDTTTRESRPKINLEDAQAIKDSLLEAVVDINEQMLIQIRERKIGKYITEPLNHGP